MTNDKIAELEQKYMNKMQLRVNCIDTNVIIAEVARATGKTEGIITPRMIRVADAMPGEVSFMVHKTYVALMTNIIPNIRAAFSQPTASGRPLLEEGIHYVIGAKKLPSHFCKPRRPITYPKHSLVFATGHHLKLVSSDMPESSAGESAVHAFIEEMKLQRGQSLKSRVFPALRGAVGKIRQCPYYLGITGVTDTARLDLGEDNWYEEYEKNVDEDVICDIVNAALHHDKALGRLFEVNNAIRSETNPLTIARLQEEQRRLKHRVEIWRPILNEMRRNQSYYIRASSFANKDFLGPKFFQTQYESLSADEFLSSICNIRIRRVVNMFFCNFKPEVHCYSDSYRYSSILSFDLGDDFRLTASYLKYFRRSEPLILGYDPGSFQSVVVAQQDERMNECRIQKEFYVYSPWDQVQLANKFDEFYGEDYDKNVEILLYYDRAGNKRREDQEQITTDARLLKRELESLGYRVRLMNEGQRTIYHYEQYKLMAILFSNRYKGLPRILLDENECPMLKSALPLAPLKKRADGRIELDKSSEVKVPIQYQAGLSTQIPSALIYLLFGLYGNKLPAEMQNIPELPENIVL